MEYVFGFILLVIVVFSILSVIPDERSNVKKESFRGNEEETRQRRQKLAEKFQKESEKKDPATIAYEEELKSKYGECSKTLKFASKFAGIYTPIRIFSESRIVLLQDKPYSFDDILSCELHDNSKVMSKNGTAHVKSNTMSTIGRAAVGGIIAGGAGSIIGGMTGGKKIETGPSVSTTIHDYTVYINVRDFNEPLIKYNVYGYYSLAAEIMALMNIITADKK